MLIQTVTKKEIPTTADLKELKHYVREEEKYRIESAKYYEEHIEKLTKLIQELKEEFKGARDETQQHETQNFFLSESSIAILKYIANKQQVIRRQDDKEEEDGDEEGITKEEITKFMDKHELASRPTTLKTIEKLIKAQIILNDRKRKNARNRLTINPEYGFREVERDLLTNSIKDIHRRFQSLTLANNELVGDLVHLILYKEMDDEKVQTDEQLHSLTEKKKNREEHIQTLIEGK